MKYFKEQKQIRPIIREDALIMFKRGDFTIGKLEDIAEYRNWDMNWFLDRI